MCFDKEKIIVSISSEYETWPLVVVHRRDLLSRDESLRPSVNRCHGTREIYDETVMSVDFWDLDCIVHFWESVLEEHNA